MTGKEVDVDMTACTASVVGGGVVGDLDSSFEGERRSWRFSCHGGAGTDRVGCDAVGGGMGLHAGTVHNGVGGQRGDQDTDLPGGEKRMVDRRWTHMLRSACLVVAGQLACPSGAGIDQTCNKERVKRIVVTCAGAGVGCVLQNLRKENRDHTTLGNWAKFGYRRGKTRSHVDSQRQRQRWQ